MAQEAAKPYGASAESGTLSVFCFLSFVAEPTSAIANAKKCRLRREPASCLLQLSSLQFRPGYTELLGKT